MSRKTPGYVIDLLVKHRAQMKHISDLIRMKQETRPENLTEYVKSLTPEKLIGRAEGYNTAIEDVLHQAKCYHGFGYVDRDGRPVVNLEDPGFRDWRRHYYMGSA